MLDQSALQFEWAEPVIGGLENIVFPADIGDVAIGVAACYITRAVIAIIFGSERRYAVLHVALHQPERPRRHIEADFAIGGRFALDIEQCHFVSRQRPAHAARVHLLARWISDHRRGLGLTVAIADGQAPGRADTLDHFGIQWLARA